MENNIVVRKKYVQKNITGWKTGMDDLLLKCKAALEIQHGKAYTNGDVMEELMKDFIHNTRSVEL